ncbi:MAG TPA: sigma-70 family RNA polymerase sigma factor [Gemmatimonadales bacterium]|jgi:RNA polymerase sigma factor (sigma-70 family)|nr:sigma-70 family RNA polymerase sigma factor [Gemmatimonadales bacterium]
MGAGAVGDMEEAWAAFVAAHSSTLMRVATGFAPGYDGALDRYAYMLDELRRHDCRRLRRFVDDGRSSFATWLAVVARRLCLDHYRRRYGRFHGPREGPERESRATRRRLADLATDVAEVTSLEDPAAADPVDRLASAEQRAALSRAVGRLAPADQLLLQLRFEYDLSARQVAALLGLPTPFHVYRRLDTLCGILRAQLTGSDTHDDPTSVPASGKKAKRAGTATATTCLG